MCNRLLYVCVVLLLMPITSRLAAAEIVGHVKRVQGEDIQITVEPNAAPKVGDAFSIVVTIPGVGDASVATGKIRVTTRALVIGRVESATGEIVAGQTVKIGPGADGPSDLPPKPATPPRDPSTPPRPVTPPKPETPATPMTPPTQAVPTAPGGLIPPPDPVPPSATGTGTRFPSDLESRATGQTEAGSEIVRAVVKIVPDIHLSGHPVDDEIGRRTVTNLLRHLDQEKVYFMQSDVDRFRKTEHLVDDQLKKGDISFAYEMLTTVLERMMECAKLADELLDEDVDFSIDESLLVDQAKTRHPMDEIAQREIWRKWIKLLLLTHKVAGSDMSTARQRVAQTLTDALRKMHDVDDAMLRDTVLICLVTAFDPESSYLSERMFADQNTQIRAESVGIGVSVESKSGYVTIKAVVPGGVAYQDNRLRMGDRIVAVGEGADGPMTDIYGMELPKAIDLIRGSEGATVRLRVLPASGFESCIVELVREKLDIGALETVLLQGQDLPCKCGAKIGYVSMPMLYGDITSVRVQNPNYRSVARDLRPKLESFYEQNVDLVLLDFRNNQGGPIEEIVDTASLFIGGNTVLRSRDRQGTISSFGDEDAETVFAAPIVILTNRMTSGGTEFIAAAIQDYDRGLVIGDPKTFGTGTIKNFYDVGKTAFDNAQSSPRLGYVRLTAAKLYRPNGDCIHRLGVTPQITLPSPTSQKIVGQAQLPFALGGDSITPIQSTGLGYGVSESLQRQLAKNSVARRRQEGFFLKLAESSASQENLNGVVSLHEPTFRRNRVPTPEHDQRRFLPGSKRVVLDGYLEEVLRIALEYAGHVRLAAGDRFQGRGVYKDALEHYRSAIRAMPDLTVAHYKLAWALATSRDQEIRNGPEALVHARRAVELSRGKVWQYQMAAAIAQAEAGNFQEAVVQLDEALSRAPAEEAEKYRFLRQRFAARNAYP